MLKFKYVFSAFCMLVAMTMATSAIAQNILSVSSGVEPRARAHGYTEEAGGITLRVESEDTGIADLDGILTIDYSIPVTNHSSSPIVVTGTGCFNTAVGSENVGVPVIEDTTVSIALGTNATNVDCNDEPASTLDVSGVLLAIAISGVESAVEASIAVSGDFRLQSGGSRVTVINAVVDELTDAGVVVPKVGGAITIIRHTGTTEGGTDGPFHLHIDENKVDSFEGAQIKLAFDGIPAGATIAVDAWVRTKLDDAGKPNPADLVSTNFVPDDEDTADVDEEAAPTRSDEVTMTPTSVTAASSITNVHMRLVDKDGDDVIFDNDADATNNDQDGYGIYAGGMLDPAKIDRITIRGYITFDEKKGAELPLSTFDVTVTADVGPSGVLNPPLAPGDDPDIPRFDSDPTSPVSVIGVTSDKTTLVLPYAVSNGTLDTGIAIANMDTKDEQSGTIMFQLFQNGDEPIEYTTSPGSGGRGLTNGELGAGGTYAVLLSDILSELGVGGSFEGGYVMITTNFTGADGIAYITDWAAFSATASLDCTSGC